MTGEEHFRVLVNQEVELRLALSIAHMQVSEGDEPRSARHLQQVRFI